VAAELPGEPSTLRPCRGCVPLVDELIARRADLERSAQGMDLYEL
jgi:hypothetical protein